MLDTVIHSQCLAALLFSVLARTHHVMMISMLASVSSSCLCLSILCVLLVLMIMFCMAEKHWYQWTINVSQSCKSCTHDENAHRKTHYWSSCTVYIGVDKIGASVELDTLAQQLVHLNQPTQIVHVIRVWINNFYTILSHLLGGSRFGIMITVVYR